jgi:hypothetical protein
MLPARLTPRGSGIDACRELDSPVQNFADIDA